MQPARPGRTGLPHARPTATRAAWRIRAGGSAATPGPAAPPTLTPPRTRGRRSVAIAAGRCRGRGHHDAPGAVRYGLAPSRLPQPAGVSALAPGDSPPA